MAVKRQKAARQKLAATNSRNFRTFLLVSQFEAAEIGRRIAQARNEASLTQDQLIEMAPFSKRSLTDYETGVTIPYKHLRWLASVLNRPVEWFVRGETSPPEPVVQRLDRIELMLAELVARLGQGE